MIVMGVGRGACNYRDFAAALSQSCRAANTRPMRRGRARLDQAFPRFLAPHGLLRHGNTARKPMPNRVSRWLRVRGTGSSRVSQVDGIGRMERSMLCAATSDRGQLRHLRAVLAAAVILSRRALSGNLSSTAVAGADYAALAEKRHGGFNHTNDAPQVVVRESLEHTCSPWPGLVGGCCSGREVRSWRTRPSQTDKPHKHH